MAFVHPQGHVFEGAARLALAESIAYERNTPPLTRELMDRFGGKGGFIFNLRMWGATTRNGPCCGYVPPDDYYRWRFDVLAKTGVAIRGADVPVEERLRGLPLKELREAAAELGVGKVRARAQAAQLLASRTGVEAWLAARYKIEDFFLLRPEEWSYMELERVWHACEKEAERREREGLG